MPGPQAQRECSDLYSGDEKNCNDLHSTETARCTTQYLIDAGDVALPSWGPFGPAEIMQFCEKKLLVDEDGRPLHPECFTNDPSLGD